VLSGLGGNDKLLGGDGNDVLTGGAGTDCVALATLQNVAYTNTLLNERVAKRHLVPT
jgi:Ca2+-binding RTX toxin-like protein